MSTELKTIKGQQEIFEPQTKTSRYEDESMSMTSFWGGKRGPCVSMTIPSGQIQLDECQVEDLVKELNHWLGR